MGKFIAVYTRFVCLLLVLTGIGQGVLAQTNSASRPQSSLSSAFNVNTLTEEPVLFAADKLAYKDDGNIVEAIGNVEIRQAGRIISADKLIYNRKSEEIVATGNVTVQDEQGNIIRTDRIALDKNFTRGFMENMQMLLAPDVQLAANYGERSGGDRLSLYKSVFSPCPACEEDPSKERLWQLKAGQIVLDENKNQVFYRNISFEVKGVPVFFLPFFAHPDPRVKRQSGFMMPSIVSSSNLGTGLSTPYFLDLGDSHDVTLTPAVYMGLSDTPGQDSGVGGVTLDGEFRQALPGGELNIKSYNLLENKGSYLDHNVFGATGENYNNAVRVKLESDLGQYSRVSGSFDGWSDREYFNEMGIDTESYGTRDLKLESFWQRSYAAASVSDQYVMRDALVATGETLPDTSSVKLAFKSEPFWGGATVTMNAEAKGLYREDGRDYGRLSSDLLLTVPFTSDLGIKTTLSAGGFGSYYKIHQADNTNTLNTANSTFDGQAHRFHPAASVRVEWPLASTNGSFDQVLEPMVQAVYAGSKSYTDFVPNEDSVELALDESNMFNLWRTNGIDKIDAGSRVDYGVRYSLFNGSDSWLSLFAGQSYKLENTNNQWGQGSGLENDFSHVIGSVTYNPGEVFDATWRFGYDFETGKFYANDVDLTITTERATAKASYETGRTNPASLALERMSLSLNLKPLDFLSLDLGYYDNFLIQNDKTYNGSISFSPTDRLTLTTGYDYTQLTDKKTYSSSVSYVHPCLNFSLTGERSFDSNGTKSDKFGLTLGLKYLGDSEQLGKN
ncbi:MAG: LPS-assembly protein LptD [Alphaproteobacteria bacterium]